MGIAISSLIPKKEINISELSGKKLTVDASNVLYQFLSSIRQVDGTPLKDSKGRVTSHIMGLSTRIPKLIEENIKLCFVFDGKPPALKFQESKIREERKIIAESKFKEAETKQDLKNMLKYSKQFTRLNREIVEESKKFIEALGLPVIQAPSEAEAQASFIAKKNDVYGVVSQDTDSLIYSTPRLIRNLTVSAKRKVNGMYVTSYPEVVELKQVLKSLEINEDQLLALSILVGTDYNPKGVKGIGPKTALKLVKEHKTFEKVFDNVNAEFDWKEIHDTFRDMPVIKKYNLKWKEPNFNKITKILESHDFSENRINKILERLTKKEKVLDNWF
jgi:flap endonuclease-1